MADFDESRQPSADDDVFLDLLDSSETRDVGIARFEERMTEAQTDLVERYVGSKGKIEDIEAVEDELNDGWRFHSMVGNLSGRVYVYDDSFLPLVPKEWGDPEVDDEVGEPFFWVEDTKLRSYQIEVITESDDETDELVDLRVAYVFSLPHDDMGKPIFKVFPGELSTHKYDTPTPEEAELRLSRQWPEEYRVIETLLGSNLSTPLARRLEILTGHIQKQLQSPIFRELVGIFVNHRLNLDQALPYILSAKDSIHTFGGATPYDADAKGEWVELTVSDGVTLLAYEPDIIFSQGKDGEVYVSFLVQTYSEELMDDPEYISILASNVTDLRGTRAIRSLAARAFDNDPDGHGLPSQDDEMQRLKDTVDILDDGMVTIAKEPEATVRNGGEPEIVQKLKRVEELLNVLLRAAEFESSRVYPTKAEALDAAESIIEEYFPRELTELEFDRFELEVSGPKLRRPVIEFKDGKHRVTFKLSKGTMFESIDEADAISGRYFTMGSFTAQVMSDDNELIGYRPVSSLVIETSNETLGLFEWDGVSLADVELQKRLAVPLDGSATIRIKELDDYRELVMMLEKMRQEYGRHPVVDVMNRLDEALSDGDLNDFKDLRHIELITDIDTQVKHLIESGKDAATLLGALEAQFVNRPIQISGDVYVNVDGKYVLDEAAIPGKLLKGTIVDVRNNVLGNDIVLSIQDKAKEIRYIPVKTVTALRF